ncbi:MAG: 30S ribosomal protein S3 [Candidatus Gottesmanbacteria bacterium GW2011_GWA2_41_12]|uniref:Small ribosomal subunit protein uS3 n=2 Tax=Candidatus Gottesmaniibacteriota TaxID=1752720 RepID=A0A0G0UI61_9BACT|nr:MAG: 30S ribosomal protein S3 [Candidatus Gottesmanbacteria bacterium GW2011_GWC2_39_8]KKR88513.1 MAG: 30S ribosomal protein S3 [Candidatus Gottesmanbacteria bacterium GW2011_GWA2_41_12]
MGQKVNPKAFRLGVISTWSSRWFANSQNYKKFLLEDVKIRKALLLKLKPAGVAEIEIERSINKVDITLHVSRPGLVIGRGGQGMEEIKKFVENIIAVNDKKAKKDKKSQFKLELKVEPVKEPNLNAYIVGNLIADQLARRLPHKRVVNSTIEKVMAAGAKGVKVMLSGRIAGAEISRREKYHQGSIPLSTIRENVDFAVVPSLTKSGFIGVKVWICRN